MNRLPNPAKTRLLPMRASAYEAFAAQAVDDYAADNIQAGRWARADAQQRALKELRKLLPQGLQTPDHHLFEVWNDSVAEGPVGSLWFAVVGAAPHRTGYVYTIRIEQAYRGRGYAKAALDAVEDIATGLGLRSIGLHVFSFDSPAQALYRSSGYGITGMNMLKPLCRDEVDTDSGFHD